MLQKHLCRSVDGEQGNHYTQALASQGLGGHAER